MFKDAGGDMVSIVSMTRKLSPVSVVTLRPARLPAQRPGRRNTFLLEAGEQRTHGDAVCACLSTTGSASNGDAQTHAGHPVSPPSIWRDLGIPDACNGRTRDRARGGCAGK